MYQSAKADGMELVDAYGKVKDVVADISGHLGNFFKAHEQLEKHVHEEELKTKKVRDPELSVNQEAFNRIMAQKEMQRLETELRETLVYSAPRELGAIWTEFEVMRDRVKAERAEVQRQELLKQQAAIWRREKIKKKIGEQLTSVFAVLFVTIWFLWLMILLRTSATYRGLYSSPSLFCVLC
ncbi:MAG: hypothetical protein EBU08_00965 [Micrococcales bacterium]|nr:hypothetical protein [Micrococcales bacterium]